MVGLNLAPRAADSAAARRSGCPLTALAEITLPLSLINTWTLTAPPARTARAAGGYGGLGKLVALPFKTPPETVFGAGGGDGLAFGGGGVSSPVVSLPVAVDKPAVPPLSTTRATPGSIFAPV